MKVHTETMLRMNFKKIKHLVELEFLLFHSLLLLLVKRFFFSKPTEISVFITFIFKLYLGGF